MPQYNRYTVEDRPVLHQAGGGPYVATLTGNLTVERLGSRLLILDPGASSRVVTIANARPSHNGDCTEVAHSGTDTSVTITVKDEDANTIIVLQAGESACIWNDSGTYAAFKNGSAATTALLAGDGSASAPAFSFSADPDTGWYRPGANRLAAAIGGVAALAIDAAGTVLRAAADTAGQSTYLQGASAGLTATAARAGGLLALIGGTGSSGNVAVAGGAGGAGSIAGGAGGATTGSGAAGAGAAGSVVGGAGGANTGSNAGGAGGAAQVTAGAGGATSSAGAHNAGAGGAAVISGGAGGAATAGTGNGGAGGDVQLKPGAGGATTGGAAGAAGKTKLYDGSDPTKILAIELSGQSTGTTRTLTPPDNDWNAATEIVDVITYEFHDAPASTIVGYLKGPAGCRASTVTARTTCAAGGITAGTVAVERDINGTTQSLLTTATVNGTDLDDSGANTQVNVGIVHATATNRDFGATSWLKFTGTNLALASADDVLVVAVTFIRSPA